MSSTDLPLCSFNSSCTLYIWNSDLRLGYVSNLSLHRLPSGGLFAFTKHPRFTAVKQCWNSYGFAHFISCVLTFFILKVSVCCSTSMAEPINCIFESSVVSVKILHPTTGILRLAQLDSLQLFFVLTDQFPKNAILSIIFHLILWWLWGIQSVMRKSLTGIRKKNMLTARTPCQSHTCRLTGVRSFRHVTFLLACCVLLTTMFGDVIVNAVKIIYNNTTLQ